MACVVSVKLVSAWSGLLRFSCGAAGVWRGPAEAARNGYVYRQISYMRNLVSSVMAARYR